MTEKQVHRELTPITMDVHDGHVHGGNSPDSEANEMAGSTVSRMDFGNFMQEVRKGTNKTLLAAGVYLEVSRQTIMRLEEGLPTKITTPQLKILLDFYGVDSAVRDEALHLWGECKSQEKTAKAQGNSQGFWHAYADQVAPHFPRYLRLEGVANHLTTHQLVLVPGLLQTAEYRRAIAKVDDPDLSAIDTERRIQLTAHRQARLNEDGFQVDALLSEAVLRHQPGGPSVMAPQLRWLVEASERDNIGLRIIPFDVGAHSGLSIQSFTMLQFPSGQAA